MAGRLRDAILSDTRANQPTATAVAIGTLYFVTDEDVLERSDGTDWTEVALNTTAHAAVDHTGLTGVGSGGGSSELTYNEYTSNVSVTATTEATANTVVTATAHTFDGSTIALIHFFAPEVRPASDAVSRTIKLALFEDGTAIGTLSNNLTPVAANDNKPVSVFRRMTPASGSRTYSVRAYVNGGTGVVVGGAGGSGVDFPGFIRITTA